jgi:hypothetical protein
MTTNVDDNNSEVVEMGSVGVGSKSLTSMNVAYSDVVTPVKMQTILDVPHDDGGLLSLESISHLVPRSGCDTSSFVQ